MARGDKRSDILTSAINVFAERGFNRARISDIARAAGVADGTIYLYFKNKDDILISIFETRMAQLIEGAEAALAPHQGDPGQALRVLAMFHIEQIEANLEVASVLLVELRLSNKFMKDYVPHALARYLKLFGDVIVDGQKKGVFSDRFDPRVVRRGLFGALDETAMQWILTPAARRYSLTGSAAEIVELFIGGLRWNPSDTAELARTGGA